ncbi:MAG TPA: Wzz/FepE/Etk N-terminal domain-containing protein [Caulobacteraceae bacterium]|nr:Wzz/FepE/Etk N-terminal domain-containing protein [Caulobacteraceae bacterium]
MITQLLNLIYDEGQRLWYYRWTFVMAATVVLCGAALYVLQLPDVYDAWAQVLVNKDTTLAAATQGVALAHPDDGNAVVVQKTLLSDQNLTPVIRQLDPAAATMNDAAMARAVARLKSRIHITSDGDDGFIEFHYADTDPVHARNVVRAVLNAFISGSVDRNKKALDDTATFLDQQIASYQTMLSDSQSKLTDFRKQHPGVSLLPNAAPLPLDTGDMGTTTITAPAAARAVAAPPAATASSERVAQLQAQIANLRTQYTDNYPDVVTARRQLEIAQAERSRELANAPAPTIASGPTQRRVVRVRRGPGFVAIAPDIQAQWQDLQRNDEVLHLNYEQLVARREATRMSLAMYSADGSNKYQVTRTPVVPPSPIGPNRGLYLVLGFLAAGAAGLGAAYLRGAMNGVFVSPRELEEAFRLPVIGTVSWEPAWDNGETRRVSRVPMIAGASLAVVLVLASVMAASISDVGRFGSTVLTNVASMLNQTRDR